MPERKVISHERWPEYLSAVVAGNRGRHIAVDTIGPSDVAPGRDTERPRISVPLTNAPFLSLEYDPVTKGNAIILATGVDSVDYEHAVAAPVELMENLDADGRLDSLEILDQNGVRTKLNFIDYDAQGFMRNPHQWRVEIAETIAEAFGLEGLGYARVQVIEYLREHYLAHGSVLPAKEVCRQVGLEEDCIGDLFGDYERAWKIAGLPDPGMQLREFMEDVG